MLGAWLLLLAQSTGVEPKTSLAVETPEEAWARPGVRVGLGYDLGLAAGLQIAPGGPAHSAVLRVGARLDELWSLFLTLRYGVLAGEVTGLRYAGLVEPTWHLGYGLSLGAGVGIGGFVVGSTGAPTPDPPGGLVASLSIPSAGPLIGACAGAGPVAALRLGYTLPVSELFALGPALEASAQWTACRQSLNRSDPDTAEPIELHQRWRHLALGLSLWLWWR